MKKRSELFFSFILIPIDYLMMIAGFVAAYIVRVKLETKPTFYHIAAVTYLKYLILLVPIWIVIFALNGLYNLTSTRGRIQEAIRVFFATATGIMVLIIIDYFSTTPFFPSKAVPLYGFVFSFLFIIGARVAIRAVQKLLFRYNIGVHHVVVMGNSDTAHELIGRLNAPNSGYTVVNKTTFNMDSWTIERLSNLVEGHIVDEIIQVDKAQDEDRLVGIIKYAEHKHIAYKYVPTLAGLYQANVASTTLAQMPVVELVHTPLDGWGRIVKRLFDVIGAVFGLIIAVPVMVAVAVLIKFTDPGPILYRHKRISKAGKELYILKFRTMYKRYCDGMEYSGKSAEEILKELGDTKLLTEFKKDFKLKDDPRVTPLGRFLRRTSLDELPQLVNVLRGQLSIVGPRPIVEQELEKYGEHGARLLTIKPGLTGLWQSSGRNDVSYDERAKLELYYVENWSLLLDILIILRTIGMIIRGNNGY